MRRAVVTGLGVVAPGGTGVRGYWDLLTSGRTATGALTRFDPSGFRSQVAAEAEFDELARGLSLTEALRLDRVAQFAVAGAREALADSGLTGVTGAADPLRRGVCLGSALGCASSLDREFATAATGTLAGRAPVRSAERLYDYFVPSSMAAEVARTAGAQGPVSLLSSGCTSGLDAIGHAVDLIREGTADVMLAGASEAPISPMTLASFDAVRIASHHRNDDPAGAARPFDRTRDGFVLGEGAALLVVEELEHARRRGAHVYGEIAGFGSRSSAFHMTALRTGGADLAEAVRAALNEARLDPGAVDHVAAHGSGTRTGDVHETAALKRALGTHAHEVPVSAVASMIGYSLGALGALAVAACLLAVEHGVVPPTANLYEPDPVCDLDYTPVTAREQRISTALTVGSGFGGTHSALLVRRV
ncbi:beta-ketoacyl-[acyl-carrier-protein] synthase family protein (plasmid) [Streptomyces sp. NBC_01351]|uniref:beta-ketoacyl-[acyl-carrier-protein] synthase family protein n=1 Tax=Streptomyces sp. NBC_01351 TaxID=2903833 RepID=UPI002E3270C8|nr:beta-ketoacyl-[acyl-carrier-protein] synthase family protein [Streptomyces sp. NBC_01351]